MSRTSLARVALAASLLVSVGGLSRAQAAPAEDSSVARTVAAAGVPKAVNGTKISRSFKNAVVALPVRTEVRSGYERTKFKHWNDVDRDCQNARAEVLRQETKKAVTGACTVRTGRWISQYDGVVTTQAGAFDVDHMVPLAEAWDSGARAWTAARRQAFANDLTERRSLIAVSASSNRSKGDRDPAQWLPARLRCQYAYQWAVVKTRWALSVDAAEKGVLTRYANACPGWTLTTYKAVVKIIGGSGGGGTGGGGGGSCTPGYSPCLPPKSDYDCAGGGGNGPGYANGPIYVTGSDPYDLDNDGDGVACEN